MKDVKFLMKIASSASDKYLSDKENMNEFIIKKAEESQLTEEEVQRIVEFSNTRTYLALRKEAEHSYVDFDVADKDEIVNRLGLSKKAEPFVSAKPGFHSDYSKPPTPPHSTIEKVAEKEMTIEKRARIFMHEESPSFELTLHHLKTQVDDDRIEYDDRMNKLVNKVRQLLLQGGDPVHVKSLFSLVDDSDVIWSGVSEKLGKEFPNIKTAEADMTKVANMEHPFVKEANRLSFLAGRMVCNAIAHDAIGEIFEKEAEEIKEAALNLKKVPTIAKVTGIGVASALLYGLGSKHAAARAKQRQLDYYRGLKPKGALI